MAPGGPAGGGPGLRGSKDSLYQHTRDDEDSQGHDGDHHQGSNGLLLLAGGHHGQEVRVFTARADVPRVAAEEDRNGQRALQAEVSFFPLPRKAGPEGKSPKGPLQPLLLEAKASAKFLLLPCTGSSCLENKG